MTKQTKQNWWVLAILVACIAVGITWYQVDQAQEASDIQLVEDQAAVAEHNNELKDENLKQSEKLACIKDGGSEQQCK